MIYLLVLAYTIFLVYKYDFKKNQDSLNFHFKCLLVISVLIGGLSYRLGIDTLRYEYMYDTFNIHQQYDYADFLGSCNEPIWYFLQKILKSIGAPFWVFRTVMLGFVNTTIFWFIRKYSPAVFFSILVYFFYSYLDFSFQVSREAMAIAFTLIGLDRFLTIKKKSLGLLRYMLWMSIAILCHHFAFIAIVVPLATYIRNWKWFIGVTILLFFMSAYLNVVLSNVGALDDNLSNTMSNYLGSEKQGYQGGMSFVMLFKNLIMSVLPIVLCLFDIKFQKKSEAFMGLTLAYVIASVSSMIFLGIMYRLCNYFIIPMAVTMGGFFSSVVVNRSKVNIYKNQIIRTFLIIWLFFAPMYTLFKSRLWPMYIPYSSVIFETENGTRESLYRSLGEN